MVDIMHSLLEPCMHHYNQLELGLIIPGTTMCMVGLPLSLQGVVDVE